MRQNKLMKIVGSTVLIAALLAGCQTKTGSSPEPAASGGETLLPASDAASAAPANPYEKHMDISIAYMDIANAIKEDQSDPILDMVQEKFNITIVPVNTSWNDYGDRTKLWAASDQLPDAFFYDQTSGDLVNQWAEQGIIKPLPADLSAYPDLKKFVDLPDVQGAAASDGQNYFIPRMLANRNELPLDRGIEIRKDWMEELGLEDPKTYDELKNVLRTIAEKKKVIGLTASGIEFIRESVFQNINPASAWWQKVDGQWIPGWMTDGYAEQVAQIRDLYQSGLLDKDFALPNMDAEGKFMQGKAAALAHTVKSMRSQVALWQKANPNSQLIDHVKILPPVPAADGKNYLYGYFDYWSGTFFNGKLSDEKQARILALLNWLASSEGKKVMLYGIEGVDWERDGDKVKVKHAPDAGFDRDKVYPSTAVLGPLAVWSDGNVYVDGYDDSEGGVMLKYLDGVEAEQLKNSDPSPINWDVNSFASSLNTGGGDLNALVTKLVINKEDIKQALKKFADEQMGLGLADAIQQVNEKYKDVN